VRGEVPEEVRRVLLVGFMGSGKTRVGRLLARRLGWPFRDFDEEIVARQGLSIPEIFRQHGEGAFREMEARVGAELLLEEQVVLASGGGWPVGPGRLEELPHGTLSVWLKVPLLEALERARMEGATRPLLQVEDPLQAAERLLETREAYYRRARVALDTHGAEPEDLARQIEELVNLRGRGKTSAPST
jgi:shikimate kinase